MNQIAPTRAIRQMKSGLGWDILHPEAKHVYWRDIADHLAGILRFNGASDISVAQHCCIVADLMPPNLRAYGLLHDAHEAYLGDIARPLKLALSQFTAGNVLQSLTDMHDVAIFEAAKITAPSPLTQKKIQHADDTALALEKVHFFPHSTLDWGPLPEPPTMKKIKPWNAAKAADEWRERLHRYLPHTRGQALPVSQH